MEIDWSISHHARSHHIPGNRREGWQFQTWHRLPRNLRPQIQPPVQRLPAEGNQPRGVFSSGRGRKYGSLLAGTAPVHQVKKAIFDDWRFKLCRYLNCFQRYHITIWLFLRQRRPRLVRFTWWPSGIRAALGGVSKTIFALWPWFSFSIISWIFQLNIFSRRCLRAGTLHPAQCHSLCWNTELNWTLVCLYS